MFEVRAIPRRPSEQKSTSCYIGSDTPCHVGHSASFLNHLVYFVRGNDLPYGIQDPRGAGQSLETRTKNPLLPKAGGGCWTWPPENIAKPGPCKEKTVGRAHRETLSLTKAATAPRFPTTLIAYNMERNCGPPYHTYCFGSTLEDEDVLPHSSSTGDNSEQESHSAGTVFFERLLLQAAACTSSTLT